MISLFLTIICSSSIALILKHNDEHNGDPLLLLAGNYFIAALLSFGYVITDHHASVSVETVIFGLLIAILFVASFFAFAKAVRAAGTALATVSSRLSVVVPLLFSIIVFGEDPSKYQLLGIIIAIVTILLFYFSLRTDGSQKLHYIDYFYLLAVLFGIGLNDFAMKVFQQWRPQADKSYFMMIIFSAATVYTFIVILIKNIPLNRRVLIRGGILGIPNMFSTFFILLALTQLPAIVVYPMTNIGIILLTTIGAAMIWKEKLNLYGKLALISGIISIIFLGF
jgi:drug/metabolite transporter (DMT)-like permease